MYQDMDKIAIEEHIMFEGQTTSHKNPTLLANLKDTTERIKRMDDAGISLNFIRQQSRRSGLCIQGRSGEIM